MAKKRRRKSPPEQEAEQAVVPAGETSAEDTAVGPAPEPEQAPAKKEHPPAKKVQSAWWLKTRAELPGRITAALAGVRRWGKENFGMEPKRMLQIFMDGLVFRNPTLVLLLGLCATLAVSVTLYSAVGMGLAVTAVLTCSGLVIALLRFVIPQRARVVCFVSVIAVFTTLADLWLQTFLPALSDSLGIFVPLIAVNGLLLARAEAFASQNTPGYALVDGIGMGLGFTAVLAALGGVRELLGTGGIAGVALLGDGYLPVLLALLPGGGFILLGLMAAGAQWLRARNWKKEKGGDAA